MFSNSVAGPFRITPNDLAMMNENKIRVKKKNKKTTKIIGLTGGIASGKTTVSNFLRDEKIPVICADDIAKMCVTPGKPAYKKIVTYFGKEILSPNHEIDRKKLGKLVFENEKLRLALNKIVHPEVVRAINIEIKKHADFPILILDVPLLFETKLDTLCDKIIVVYSSLHHQKKRLQKRNKLSMEEATLRINAQMPLIDKIERADFVIDNSGPLEKTRDQVKALVKKI